MPFIDRGTSHLTVDPPVYTVYPGRQQGSTNYGFHLSHPQTPPPKYEDVVSGEYQMWNFTNYGHTALPTTINTSLPPSPESELPHQESHKDKRHTAVGVLLFAFLLTVIFIWRVTIM